MTVPVTLRISASRHQQEPRARRRVRRACHPRLRLRHLGPHPAQAAHPRPLLLGPGPLPGHREPVRQRFLDWKASAASSHQGTLARYEALTDGTRLPLAERAVFAPSWYLPEVLPGIPNPPSPFREEVGGRLVIDVWGGSFERVEKDLQDPGRSRRQGRHRPDPQLAARRLRQRPARPLPGRGRQGRRGRHEALIATGKRLGHLMALHENYVDYYPNYEHFNEREIALNSCWRASEGLVQQGHRHPVVCRRA